jgi:hypothetical protein
MSMSCWSILESANSLGSADWSFETLIAGRRRNNAFSEADKRSLGWHMIRLLCDKELHRRLHA